MLLNFTHRHLNGLSWVRFGLALYLIFFHTIHNYKDMPDWLIASASAGYISTSMFFILSGYVLTHVYYDQEGVLRIPRKQFLFARFYTLYPLHLVGFFLAAFIMYGQYLLSGNVIAVADIPPALSTANQDSVLIFLHGPEIALNALLHLFLLHAWNPLYLTFNIPSWSISALMFFYVAFVFFGKYIPRIRYPLLTLALLNFIYLLPPLYFILTSNYGSVATGLLHTNPLMRLPEFLSGVVLCVCLRSTGETKVKFSVFLGSFLLALLGMIGLAVAALQVQNVGYNLVHNGILLPLQLVLIGLFAGVRDVRIEWLSKLIARLGNATLSIFVLHLPLFYLLTHIEKLVSILFSNPSFSAIGVQMKHTDLSIAFYPLNVVLVIAISVVVQEQFVLKIRKWLQM